MRSLDEATESLRRILQVAEAANATLMAPGGYGRDLRERLEDVDEPPKRRRARCVIQ